MSELKNIPIGSALKQMGACSGAISYYSELGRAWKKAYKRSTAYSLCLMICKLEGKKIDFYYPVPERINSCEIQIFSWENCPKKFENEFKNQTNAMHLTKADLVEKYSFEELRKMIERVLTPVTASYHRGYIIPPEEGKNIYGWQSK